MSDETKVKACSSKQLRIEGREKRDQEQGKEEMSDKGAIQDQIIIAPEIMKKIFENLSLRTLKQVRLVCKSWLLEAQVHFETRGIVRLYTNSCSTRVEKFIATSLKKIPGLPQPFQSIDVDLSMDEDEEPLPHELIISQLTSLSTPLEIRRLSLGTTPLRLSFVPLIIRSSSSLEYLKLSSETYEAGFSPLVSPDQISFPMLRHLDVALSNSDGDSTADENSFAHLMAWMTIVSPNLETYESRGEVSEELEDLTSDLLLELDLPKVKSLALVQHRINEEACDYVHSAPFSGLQYLRMDIWPGFLFYMPFMLPVWASNSLRKNVEQSAATLRVLDLSSGMKLVENIAVSFFPVCPNVQELTISTFPYKNNVISTRFPALQVLNVCGVDPEVIEHSDEFLPLFGVKTLRVRGVQLFKNNDEDTEDEPEPDMEFKIFGKFPSLDSLYLHYSLLMHCCSRIASTGHPEFSNMLDGIKHLEVHGNPVLWSDAGFSFLAVLKQLETIALTSFSESVTTVPVKELPLLKVIQFPWGICSNLEQLLELGKGVKKIVITNCCSFARVGDPESKELLERFFDSLPNAECGGGDKDKSMPPVHWTREERVQDDEADDSEEDEENGNNSGDESDAVLA